MSAVDLPAAATADEAPAGTAVIAAPQPAAAAAAAAVSFDTTDRRPEAPQLLLPQVAAAAVATEQTQPTGHHGCLAGCKCCSGRGYGRRSWLGAGVRDDFRQRLLRHYLEDWRDGLRCGWRILAPSLYIYFASVLPALAFGQQLAGLTDSLLGPLQVLAATALAGLVQSLAGGQPLLIVGVAEPIVITYGFMFSIVRGSGLIGADLFLAWACWVCLFAALLLVLLSLANACRLVDRFTPFSGELFGLLIAVLFAQACVEGLVHEFRPDEAAADATASDARAAWALVRGLFSLLLASGLLLSCLALDKARRWTVGTAWLRGLAADYGAVSMVVVWSAVSFALGPDASVHRIDTRHLWQMSSSSWTVAADLGRVPGALIAAALLPAVAIAVLFFFDHNVSSRMAQTFNGQRPSTYHYDLLLLAGMTAACGLLGLPPVNGVLPQAPMHTKSLFTLREQLELVRLRRAKRDVEFALEEQEHAVAAAAPDGNADRPRDPVQRRPQHQHLADAVEAELADVANISFDEINAVDVASNPVAEQRLSNLLQSTFIAITLALTHVISQIPSAVVYGYFAYMALSSLPGSTLWLRIKLVFTTRTRWQSHTAPFTVIARTPLLAFTLLQTALCAGVWALTRFAGIGGLVFPIPIMLLVPFRFYVLPRLFDRRDLELLDPST